MIVYLFMIILFINKNLNEIIKDKPFHLIKEKDNKYIVGKEYNENEFDDYTYCNIEDNKNKKFSEIVN